MSLRRAFSRLAPRIVGAISEAAIISEKNCTAVLRIGALPVGPQHAAVISLRQFRSSTSPCSSLLKTLQSEVEYEKENYNAPEDLAKGPPAPFKLQETPEDTQITLTRDFHGETISVDLMVNNQPEQEPYETENGELEVDVGVMFNVSVVKGDKRLVFECRSDGSYMVIQHVSFEPADGEVSESAYTGPVYEELDEQLQTDFSDYLLERGITEELGAYLLQLLHDKEEREYMGWLQNVHGFVSK